MPIRLAPYEATLSYVILARDTEKRKPCFRFNYASLRVIRGERVLYGIWIILNLWVIPSYWTITRLFTFF